MGGRLTAERRFIASLLANATLDEEETCVEFTCVEVTCALASAETAGDGVSGKSAKPGEAERKRERTCVNTKTLLLQII